MNQTFDLERSFMFLMFQAKPPLARSTPTEGWFSNVPHH